MRKKEYNLANAVDLTSKDKIALSALLRSSMESLINTESAKKVLKTFNASTVRLLERFEKRGWVKRVKKGWYYILPLESTKKEGGIVSDPLVIASVLYSPCYIGGWTAAEYWEMTEQLFRPTFVVSSKNIREKNQILLENEFCVVRVPENRVNQDEKGNGIGLIWRGSHQIAISNPERTIVDGLLYPGWVGGFKHLIEMFRNYAENPECNYEKLFLTAKTLNKGSVLKRLGILLERIAPKEKKILTALKKNLPGGIIKLDPNIRSRGKHNITWGVWENVTI